MNGKVGFIAFVLGLFICSSAVAGLSPGGSAQSGLVVSINSDTTWSSDFTLTGPTVVNPGVTLTINSGVTVNLNGYTLLVNGTLKAYGTTAHNIHINGANITFGAAASGNSEFYNVVTNAQITSSKPLKLDNNTLNNALTVGDASVITNNVINGAVKAENTATLTSNIITGDVTATDSATLKDSKVVGDVTLGENATVSNNFIKGSRFISSGLGGVSVTTALTVGRRSTIMHNAISGSVTATSSTVSDNTIAGGAPFTDWVGRPEDATSALSIGGDSSVTANVLYSPTSGYGLLIRSGNTVVSGNLVNDRIRVAGGATIENNLVTSGGIQVGEIYISAFNEIDYGHGNALIQNNVIKDSYYGVSSSYIGGSATIQNNLILNCSVGISLISQAVIQKNTIYNTTTAISLKNTAPAINYNNILTYNQNSVTLVDNPLNVNATYNWWGTTDTQAIGLSIHDSKYDLDLCTVNIDPILTAQNAEAPAITFTVTAPSPPELSSEIPQPTPTPTATSPTVNPTDSTTAAPSPTTNTNPTPTETPTIPEVLPILLPIVVLAATVIGLVLTKKRLKNLS